MRKKDFLGSFHADKDKFAQSYTAKHKFHSENSVALHLHEGPVYREIEIEKKDNKETWDLS